MNAERLHAIAIELQTELDETELPGKVQELVNALQNAVNQPQANHQQILGGALENLYAVLSDVPSNAFSPGWCQVVDEIGGTQLLGHVLQERIQGIFQRNQITPSVALQEMQEIQQSLEAFKNAIDQIVEGLKCLEVGAEELEPGECELGVVVPRDAVDNKLGEFAKELNELCFVFKTFSEIATGKPDEFKIKTLSSSELMVYLEMIPRVAACVAVAVERIIALYKKLLEIRKLKSDLENEGVPKGKTKSIEEHADGMMQVGIDKISKDIAKQFCRNSDESRKNELGNQLRIALNKIANRIDAGYNIEVRVEPLEESEGEDETKRDQDTTKNISLIQKASKTLQFMKLEGAPLLHLPEKATETKAKKKN